jgi:hypothetical protein
MKIFFLLALLFTSAYAHIAGIVPSTATYKPSKTSTHSVRFRTLNGPTTFYDFSVVFGIAGPHQKLFPTAFQDFVKVYNLAALGYQSTVCHL